MISNNCERKRIAFASGNATFPLPRILTCKVFWPVTEAASLFVSDVFRVRFPVGDVVLFVQPYQNQSYKTPEVRIPSNFPYNHELLADFVLTIVYSILSWNNSTSGSIEIYVNEAVKVIDCIFVRSTCLGFFVTVCCNSLRDSAPAEDGWCHWLSITNNVFAKFVTNVSQFFQHNVPCPSPKISGITERSLLPKKSVFATVNRKTGHKEDPEKKLSWIANVDGTTDESFLLIKWKIFEDYGLLYKSIDICSYIGPRETHEVR